jgi:decaprenylphosphoryl-5-phosphoribose phosphatase
VLVRRAAALDLAVFRFLRTAGHGPRAEAWMARFSALGEHAAIWLLIGAAGTALDAPHRARWLRATATVVAAYALNTAIKLAIRRRRPRIRSLPPLAGTPTALSFPSAHATSSFAAARAYAPLIPGRPLYALAAALTLSRLYLGVHYPSDSLAGIALGLAVGGRGR